MAGADAGRMDASDGVPHNISFDKGKYTVQHRDVHILSNAGSLPVVQGQHDAGKRVGIALNPDSNVEILIPILKEIDEVMVMGVKPGAAGQKFNDDVLQKIKTLDYTRKKHCLKYLISVDGGINPDTAKLCWNAGADLLVSGSYLAHANDFPLAVQSLLNH